MKIRELIEAKVRILNENKDGDVMNVSVPWIQSDKKNQNGRVYPKSLLQREIARVQNSVLAQATVVTEPETTKTSLHGSEFSKTWKTTKKGLPLP